jgi:hypothetical protein
MAQRLKVIFKRVFVLNDADWFGSGEFYFIAKVDGQPVGNRKQTFDAVERTWINLAEAQWSAVVDVTGKAAVVVNFHGMDEDWIFDDDLGSVTYTLRRDYQEGVFRHQTEYFILEWEVQLEIDGAFARHAPTSVYACRGTVGSNTCVTVSGATFLARMEFHECRPTPNGVADAPNRPPFPPGTVAPVLNIAGVGDRSPGDAPNTIPNPPVIPILAGAAINNQNAARIEFTWFRPGDLAFTDNDPRLTWTFTQLNGGSVTFLGGNTGRKVMVYGTARGEVKLEVRFRGAVIGIYRALVLPMGTVTCRFNILNGPTAQSQPRATPADVLDHFAIANVWLRPLGIQLQLDTNPARTNGATATATPGIFRIRVGAGTTRNIPSAFPPGTVLNHRPNVMNFAYVHSAAAPAPGFIILGAAIDRASNVGAALPTADSGTPSTSWVSPNGITPDGAPAATNIVLRPTRLRTHPPPNLFSMFISNDCGDPTVLASQNVYARVIAHELGHVLHLGHRGVAATVSDGVNFPINENIMNPIATAITEDWDIIQARAVRLSPLVV